MTEALKTLKDILEINGIDYESGDWTQPNNTLIDLREEAIKWIKELNTHKIGDMPEVILKLVRTYQILWIKHFFNITEDELK